MMILVLYGGALASGVLAELDGAAILFTGAVILIIRPIAGALGLIGFPGPWTERAVIAFYGIRGVGSAYYLAYALNQESFARPEYLWSVTSLTILVSVLLHGTTVTPAMRFLDRHRTRHIRSPR